MSLCLGLDPGIGRLGYAFVSKEGDTFKAVNFGCIETSPKKNLTERLLDVHITLGKMIEENKPDLLAVEKLFFGRNTTTAEVVYQVRGIILLNAGLQKIGVVEPKPTQIKMAICGHGRATKRQVQLMVQRTLGLAKPPTPDDVADALATAIAGLLLHEFAQKTGGPIDAPLS
ncbi:Holliday junction endonuclease RuvC [Thermovirga lienii DSM 17291]|jgi:crossover junction endodeoxyribonuclease RuvC|uniref:Crossover junction endodeoxyribonuclease RuvC n=1 Tax=Thermovirga lienii (strain ATCC BAA-1197 / DSM 17291 / Cas60314) TaxID=580340 RepID=G7VA66_THELD|nr:crossover junction endodeoxyribonuclease RuvC [Thermovirga lienii]AER66766.1 Holliday junction endonuclease RuvC [Thermovirga lienii DSM 17291]KUK42266.1 MAG: Crossover junction endodeoxyribonuclease RuvC [Thermovirga lienii]MDN5318283.1 crossover junction endodeoxyribonuclease RuvC [Thermovirga sp.]MDN5367425.1 crossover junction endodeoxyribonuclease RuvC [Thermovirga sp.]